jgi:inorganic pyrophosphatase
MFSLTACNLAHQKNLGDLPAFIKGDTIRCVIEVPAGTNKKIEYSDSENTFRIDTRGGKKRIIRFLPYPTNYGFIPSTRSDVSEGGDGDHLDVVLLSESLDTGTVIDVIPIAVLKLLDNGEKDFKIVCVPIEMDKQIITAFSLSELERDYPAIIEILNLWFTNYDNKDALEIAGWGDRQESIQLIQNSIK